MSHAEELKDFDWQHPQDTHCGWDFPNPIGKIYVDRKNRYATYQTYIRRLFSDRYPIQSKPKMQAFGFSRAALYTCDPNN